MEELAAEYEVFYRGKRKTVPSSRYGVWLELMEAMGWDWWTLMEQPADLVDEMIVKLSARNRVQANPPKEPSYAKRR